MGILRYRLRLRALRSVRNEASGGFTLLEMLIVLAILSLAVAMAFPLLARRAPGAALAAATEEVRSALAAARSAAIAEDRDVVFGGGFGAIAVDGVRRALPRLASISVEVRGPPIIEFHPSGASSGGRIVLRSVTRRREIEVEPLTGHAILLP